MNTPDPERQPAASPSARTDREGPVFAHSLSAVGIVATLLHGAFDLVTARIAILTPPYLRLGDAPEEFQMLSPVAVSIAVSCVSGVIAVICVAAVQPPQRRPRVLAAMITCFWLFSAVLLRIVWLSTPWSTTVVALLPGVARGAVIGWIVAALSTRRVNVTRDGAV